MPLDRALRRARTPLSEVECFTYDGKSCIGTLTCHHMPEALYVADRDNEQLDPPKAQQPGFSNTHIGFSNTHMNLSTGQGNTVIEMVTELEKMSVLHRACPVVAPLDPITRYVRIGPRRYPLYLCGGDMLAAPSSMAEVMDIARTLSRAIRSVHDAGYVLWNISPRSIYYGPGGGGKNNKQVKLGPNIVIPMRKQSFADFRGSVILGSTIVSPIQVLIDMLASRYEQDLVPFSEFKAKFSGFWPRTLPKEFRHVPDIVSCYHSMKDGSTEYLDHLFCRWLTVKAEKKKTERFIVKDPATLLKPAVLCCVDWFALGVTLDGYVEALLEKEAPPKALTEAICTMVVNMECGFAPPHDAHI